MPKTHFVSHRLILGNRTMKLLLRSQWCHSFCLLNDSADQLKIESLLEVTQEGRIRASSGLAEREADVYPAICN